MTGVVSDARRQLLHPSRGRAPRVARRMRMQGLAFLVQEHGLCGPGEAGEEIVMVAGR